MRNLVVELSLTSECSLKCQYCYSSHKPEYMQNFNLAEFELRIEPIMKYYNCDTYHISYFGGEPLLNWDIIEQSLPQFRQSSKCSSIVLISNGLLLDAEKTAFLKSYKCGLSWSFDGLWSKYRTTKLEDAEAIMPYALQLTSSCKVMVSPLSRNYTENLKYFISKGIYHPDFSLVRDDIWTKKNIEYFAEQMRELSDFIIAWNLENANNHHIQNNHYSDKLQIVSTGLHSLYALDAFAGAKFGKRNHGCFVGSNGILYATDGSIWPCERFRSNSAFKLAESLQNSSIDANIHYSDDMQSGNYTDGVNYENLKFLKDISNPQDYPKCQQCELYKYCNAGCTYSQLKIPANLQITQNTSKEENLQPRNLEICEIIEPIDSVCELQRICYKEALRVFKNAGKNYENYIYRLFENAN